MFDLIECHAVPSGKGLNGSLGSSVICRPPWLARAPRATPDRLAVAHSAASISRLLGAAAGRRRGSARRDLADRKHRYRSMDIELPGAFTMHMVGRRWWIEAPSTSDPVRRAPIRIPVGGAAPSLQRRFFFFPIRTSIPLDSEFCPIWRGERK
jgi:hypothetical protein